MAIRKLSYPPRGVMLPLDASWPHRRAYIVFSKVSAGRGVDLDAVRIDQLAVGVAHEATSSLSPFGIALQRICSLVW
jgi:hypothetical protein